MIRILFLLLILFCVGGCSSLAQQTEKMEQQSSAQILKLLPPEQGPSPVLLKQAVTMEMSGSQHQFIAIIRLELEQVQMMALLPTGQQLFLLEYDGKNLSQDNYSSVEIPGKEILTIMQFALWPESSVRQNYSEKEGWDLEFDSDQRWLKNSTETFLEVKFEKDDLIVVNHQHHYKILIQTLEKKML